jgi:hypothetical protein
MSLSVVAQPEVMPASRVAVWAGRLLTTLVVLFLLFDGIAKVLRVAPVLEASARLEVPERVIPSLGAVLIAATLLHAVPTTSVLGAIVLTGYLGGATWTHARMGGPDFPTVFPVLFGALLWLGLYLREPRLRALIPLQRS